MKNYLIIALVALAMATMVVSIASAQDAAVMDASQPIVDAGAPAPVADDATPAPGPSIDIESDPIGSVSRFVSAIKSGNWKLVGAMALALLMLVLAKTRDRVKWFKGDRGGAVLVSVLGLAGGFSAALSTGTAIDWKLVLGIFATTWTAVGGVTWFKRIIWPKD